MDKDEVRIELITVILTSTLNVILSLYQIYSQKKRSKHFKFNCNNCVEIEYSDSETSHSQTE